MTNEKILNTLKEVESNLAFIFIGILFSLPFLKQLSVINTYVSKIDYGILFTFGFIGALFLGLYLYLLFEKSENKKQFFKDILPIFLLFLFMCWTFISVCFSENKQFAIYGTIYRKDGYLTYIAYAGCFSLAFFICSNKMKKTLLYIFIIAAMLTLASIQLAKHGYFTNYICNTDIKRASFNQFNHFGYYLLIANALSSFLFINEKNKVLKLINFIMYSYLLYFLVLNDTFGCYLALILTFIMFFITSIIKKENRIQILILIVVFVIISFLVNTGDKNIATQNITTLQSDINSILTTSPDNTKFQKAGTGRMKLWIYGLKFFTEKPILGHGPENLGNKYEQQKIIQDRPHNLLIQLATTSGLPGLILYILAISIIILKGLKNLDIKNQLHVVFLFTAISYLISAMFGNSMYYTSPYFFIILGFLMSYNIRIKSKKEP